MRFGATMNSGEEGPAGRDGDSVVGPPVPVIFGMSAAALVILVTCYSLVTVSNAGPVRGDLVRDFVLPAVFLALGASLMTAAMWSRIVVRGDELVVVNMYVEHVVPRGAVASVDGTNGVIISLRDGQEIEPTMDARSVWQMLVRHRRYARVAGAVERWAEEGRPSSEPARPVVTRRSAAVLPGVPACLVVCVAYGALLWLLTPAVYPWVTA